jgi:hypothetical protein
MEECDMAGCYDTAEFFADFYEETETDLNGVILEICESCADYWREHKEEPVRITPYANRKEAAQND